MKIAFDVQPLINKKKTGIGFCQDGVLKTLLSMYPENQYYMDFFSYNNQKSNNLNLLAEYIRKGALTSDCTWFSGRVYRFLWNFIPLSYNFFFPRKVDITHFFNYHVPPGVKKKTITTVHDMAFKSYPETVRLKTKIMLKISLKKSCKRADKIMTISEFSKNEIIKYLGIKPDKIFVTHIGVNRDFFKPIENEVLIDSIKSKYKIFDRYFLYLGTIEPRKNLERLIEAYFKLREMIPNAPLLVLAGQKGWLYDSIFKKVKDLKLEKFVIFTGYIKNEDRALILNGALGFVFPSLYEGFGMPPLEAMSCGTPVISSNCTSLPEVIGDAGILVDPYNTNEITLGMKKIVENPELRKKLSLKGIERAKIFTWENSVKKIIDEYKKLLGEN